MHLLVYAPSGRRCRDLSAVLIVVRECADGSASVQGLTHITGAQRKSQLPMLKKRVCSVGSSAQGARSGASAVSLFLIIRPPPRSTPFPYPPLFRPTTSSSCPRR